VVFPKNVGLLKEFGTPDQFLAPYCTTAAASQSLWILLRFDPSAYS